MPRRLRGVEYVRGDDLFLQALELGIGKAYPVKGLEILAKTMFERRTIANLTPQHVLELSELFNELLFHRGFPDLHRNFLFE